MQSTALHAFFCASLPCTFHMHPLPGPACVHLSASFNLVCTVFPFCFNALRTLLPHLASFLPATTFLFCRASSSPLACTPRLACAPSLPHITRLACTSLHPVSVPFLPCVHSFPTSHYPSGYTSHAHTLFPSPFRLVCFYILYACPILACTRAHFVCASHLYVHTCTLCMRVPSLRARHTLACTPHLCVHASSFACTPPHLAFFPHPA